MNLVLDVDNYNNNNVFLYEPVKNTVMEDSKFIRIIYSDEHIILNGIYIKIDINDNNILNFIDNIENVILKKYNINKIKLNKLKEQLEFLIKKYSNEYIYILKISGIWETTNMVGLTYKFISINHL